MKGAVYLQHLGRFGNQIFGYAHARSYCERHGFTLYTDPWVGQHVFEVSDLPPPKDAIWESRDENNLQDGESGIVLRSYCQQQKCMTYSKSDCLRWLRLKRQWEFLLGGYQFPEVVGHRRVGDYVGYNYTFLSEKSFRDAALEFALPPIKILTEEKPMTVLGIPDGLSFLPDFYCMMTAKILLRGNSSFSWWAATLNRSGTVYSPVIDGLSGGERDVKFVLGNHPRLSHHEFCTELHLKP